MTQAPAAPTAAPPALGRLHVIVDVAPGRDGLALVDQVLAAGAPVVQVRAKAGTDAQRWALARAVAERCGHAGAACVVNDRVDLALALGAGWHGGADDLPVAVARRLLGPGAVVGGTARHPDAARRLAAEGASYLGVGPVWATTSKDGLPPPIGLGALADVVAAVDVPVIAISGVTAGRVPEVLATGAHGVAVIGAVAQAPDPGAAVAELLEALGPAPSGAGR